MLTSLSLSEVETKATVNDNGLQMEGMKGNRDTCLQSSPLATRISSLVQLQTENHPHSESHATSSVPSSSTAGEYIQKVDAPTGSISSTSSLRPLLLSMPLLTDLQPLNVDQLPPLSCNDAISYELPKAAPLAAHRLLITMILLKLPAVI